uniref:Mitochondrial ribosome associated GTPase 1 n=1 Tax=Sus scrofa TaxID=9823 RepID=A0A8D2A7A8_PIG
MCSCPSGLRKMQSSLKLVDCILEVHDARIPLSGRNPLFQETLGLKPHLLVLNKMDLADLKEQQKIMQHLEREGLKNVIFTNCVKDENIKQIIPKVTELVGSSCRYHRGESVEYCIMVIGVPNVGKSSLINALRRQHLRKGKATKVGGEPGITRAVMSRVQVCERPLMFLLDTPGVLAPRIQNVETGLKLALCGEPGPQTPGRVGWASLGQAAAEPCRAVAQDISGSANGPGPQRMPWHPPSPAEPSASPGGGVLFPFDRWGWEARSGSLSRLPQRPTGAPTAHPRLPVPRNRAGPPGGGGDPGRLPPLHPQQAPAPGVRAALRPGPGLRRHHERAEAGGRAAEEDAEGEGADRHG